MPKVTKVNLANGPCTVTSTVPEGENYTLFEDDRTHVGKSPYCTSGLWDDNSKGPISAWGGAKNLKVYDYFENNRLYNLTSEQQLTDFIRIETRFLYDYVTAKNQYNLKVVKELLEGMLQEVNNRINWMSEIEEKLNSEK